MYTARLLALFAEAIRAIGSEILRPVRRLLDRGRPEPWDTLP